MPIVPPRLDDRSFEDLARELLARIPAHTPEWTHARPGDPGRTLLELFAWLGDTLLYRANLIPERQRLVFLRLLGVDMRPAAAATGLVGLRFDPPKPDALQPTVTLRPLAEVKGPASFETREEVTVVDCAAEAYCKRPMTPHERDEMAAWLPGLAKAYGLDASVDPRYYVTTPVFADAADPGGFDLIGDTIDASLWLALLARRPAHVAALREDLRSGTGGAHRVLHVGVAPAIETPPLFEEIGDRGRIPHAWEISGPLDEAGRPTFSQLTVIRDTTRGLTRRGVLQLVVSGVPCDAPPNDVRRNPRAGIGPAPPRLDDPDRQARLVAWIRLRPAVPVARLGLSWVGINAVAIDQRKTLTGAVIGKSDGAADQSLRLPANAFERDSLRIEVEEPGLGYRPWAAIDDLMFAGREDAVFQLDVEAGALRFGDGVRGRIPAAGMRVRVAFMRAGGGAAGNLPAGSLKDVAQARTVQGDLAPRLVASQALATVGGRDAETLAEAERRIPASLRHGERAVTGEDYRNLAAETPGVVLGRVEVLPKFKPHQRREDVPGVVSVMALPFSAAFRAPNPRPDRPTLESVHAHLDVRRTLGAELYVIGCEYVPIAVGVGVTVREEFGRETVTNAVHEALHRFLWPLPPGGPLGAGWPLRRPVKDRELEVAVAQVPGVETVAGVALFVRGPVSRAATQRGGAASFTPSPTAASASAATKPRWTALAGPVPGMPVELVLRPWQLPELLGVVVDADGAVPTDPDRGLPGHGDDDAGIGVPVVPEVC